MDKETQLLKWRERRKRYVANKLAELNTYLIPCACGCGTLIPPYNARFVRRYYAFGHSPKAKLAQETATNSIRGKPFSQEHKDKISQALKDKPKTADAIKRRLDSVLANGSYKGENNPFYGKIHNQETRDKLSSYAKLRVLDKNPNWRGGINQLPYHPNFTKGYKKLIRQRDGNKCQYCGRTRRQEGKELSVHHIDHDKMNNDPSNLITVCNRCNIYFSFHRNLSLIAFPKRRMLLT